MYCKSLLNNYDRQQSSEKKKNMVGYNTTKTKVVIQKNNSSCIKIKKNITNKVEHILEQL